MNIIQKKYAWNGQLSKRPKTNYIVLHHTASSKCSPDDIHKIHLNNGWTGIGYHFYVRKDGSVYTGRPIDMLGAHVTNYNSQCLGVCFEGNFEIEKMTEAQIKSGQELISYLKGVYPKAQIKKHRDLNATACPGKNFEFDKIITLEYTEACDIVNELNKRGIITSPELWNSKCNTDANAYWLTRKAANMTVNFKRYANLETVNDIVWELNYRGIMTDMKLWLKLLEEDNNLYWLAYKICNMTKNK